MNHSSLVADLTPRLVSNLGNLHNVLLHGLDSNFAHIGEIMRGIILLNDLCLMMNHGLTPLMLRLPEMLAGMEDHELHGRFLIGALQAWQFYTVPNLDKSIDEAIKHLRTIKNLRGEGRLYDAIATYYLDRIGDVKKAENFYGRVLSLASQCDSDVLQLRGLGGLAIIEYRRGNYWECLRLARKTHRIAVATGSVSGEFHGVRWQALCYQALGDFKRSTQLLDQGKKLVDRAGMQGGLLESMLMNTEGDLYQLKTEYAEARHIQEVIMHQTSAVLSPIIHAYALVNIAFIDIVTGASTDVVSRNLDTTTMLFRNAQSQREISACELYQADLMLREGHTAEARTVYMRIFGIFSGLQRNDELACHCLSKLADPTNPMHAEMQAARWAFFLSNMKLLLCYKKLHYDNAPNFKQWRCQTTAEFREIHYY
ncbi:hypothetical protein B0H19DRAFT_1082314 [Mycena capillaripes]|nr:hypothetical protein B0H19DRAFT_1082314 [Mycena capillaripes]